MGGDKIFGDKIFGDKVGGNKYGGPVFYGSADGAQVVMNSSGVSQGARDVAHGFEPLAQVVVRVLAELDRSGLPGTERAEVEKAGAAVLEEVTKPAPDRGVVHRSLAAIKGFLAPVAMGLSTGAAEATQGWAKQAVEQLGTAF